MAREQATGVLGQLAADTSIGAGGRRKELLDRRQENEDKRQVPEASTNSYRCKGGRGQEKGDRWQGAYSLNRLLQEREDRRQESDQVRRRRKRRRRK